MAVRPDRTELMAWLVQPRAVHPYGHLVAASVSAGGRRYHLWAGRHRSGEYTASYQLTAGTTEVTGLDIGALAQDAASRGYLPRSCYLIDVEAGFELWRGGTGLATTAFSVTLTR